MVPTTETKKLKAFHNNPQLKKDMVSEILNHQKQDQIIKGTYGTNQGDKWKGCAVGCSIHSYNIRYGKNISPEDHSAYASELGIPESLALLEDSLFEMMPIDKSKKWPLEFMKSISIGANLSMVAAKFISATLRDVVKNKYVKSDIEVVKSVLDIVKLWEQVISGKLVKPAAWSAAESAAESAARSAAESAARSAAWSASWSAARSAARSAAESAARSAAWSASRSAAESAACSAAESAACSAAAYKMSRRLLKIIRSCK